GFEHVARAPGVDGCKRGFCSHHSGEHGGVRALDAGSVHEPRCAADQRAARKREPRDRLEASLCERAGAIGDALAALEMFADERMRLGALKLFDWIEIGIGVVEMDDEADRHQSLAKVIKK